MNDRHGNRPNPLEVAVEWVLLGSRILVIVPVLVLLLAALAAFGYGVNVFAHSIRGLNEHPLPVGDNIGLFILIVDLFLVGTTLLIAAVGLYELFISRLDAGGPRTRLPAWLEMHDLNDLKARVISMVILVAAVTFVDAVVDFRRAGLYILELGGGVAVVIGALTLFLRFGHPRREG